MSQIASKNLYELLGNDLELDPDRAPEPPTKAIDKPVQRTGKRNAGAENPAIDRTAAGGRGGRPARGDQAGSLNNRAEQRDDGLRNDRRTRDSNHRGGERGRGPRGERRGRGRGEGRGGPRDDRHSHTGIGDHEKQAAHGWGAENANAELTDENAGDAIAAAELKNEAGADGDGNGIDAAGEDAEAENDKTKSYDQYLAEQAEKRLALSGGAPSIRQANEGSKQKFPEGTAHARNPEEENYFAGANSKTGKAKEVKQKNVLTMDGQYYAPPDSGDRGGRGGRGRGGRGRGEGRGEYRGRGGRGRGEGRGGHRGDRNDAPRGRGINTSDESAFPALGGS